MPNHFDIAVLGSGPGGYVAALKAAQLGAKTAIVEKHYLGGTCLNRGCIPSKAILASAELLHHIRHAADMGVEVAGAVTANWDKIQSRKDKILNSLRGGIKGLLGARKVTIFNGRASLNGPGKVVVTKDGAKQEFTAAKTILAVGSVPSPHPRLAHRQQFRLHQRRSPALENPPQAPAHRRRRRHRLRVRLHDAAPRRRRHASSRCSPKSSPASTPKSPPRLSKIFTQRGVQILVGTKIESVAINGQTVTVTLADGKKLEADRVLVATGRRANTADINLESIGLSTDRGFIRVDDKMQTTVKDYSCIGDANGRCLLAHAASAHGVVAAENALGHMQSFTAPVPNCVYTFPEIAAVGLTAKEAREKGHNITVGQFPLGHLGKAMAAGDTDGFVRVIRDRISGDLLGVHMMGHNVTECIASAGAMLHQKVSVADVADTVFAHPTISESIKEAAEDAMSMALHLPPRKILRAVAQV